MLTYDVCRYIFIGAAVLCGLMFVVSVLLFILLKIPKVIGDLSGVTAKKAIENIRNQNESSGDKTYKSSHVNKERGKITDKISPSGRLIRNHTAQVGAMATEKIGTQRLAANETTVLGSENETTVLTGDLGGASNETTVLTGDLGGMANETTVLNQMGAADTEFRIEYEITYIHTQEIIVPEVN